MKIAIPNGLYAVQIDLLPWTAALAGRASQHLKQIL